MVLTHTKFPILKINDLLSFCFYCKLNAYKPISCLELHKKKKSANNSVNNLASKSLAIVFSHGLKQVHMDVFRGGCNFNSKYSAGSLNSFGCKVARTIKRKVLDLEIGSQKHHDKVNSRLLKKMVI